MRDPCRRRLPADVEPPRPAEHGTLNGTAPVYFDAAVGSGLAALDRIDGMLDRIAAAEDPVALLHTRVAPDIFPTGRQLWTAANFTQRIAYPLAGRLRADLPAYEPATHALRRAAGIARGMLADLTAAEFEGAEARRIAHRAGFADLDQSAADFLFRFGLPNLNFHLAMAYAALRAAGVPLGKADFDGLHAYPLGYRFPE